MDLSQAERYAALLDGKCTPQEREELLAQLAAGGDDLEIFADAAALLHENEEEQPADGVIPLRQPVPTPAERPRWKPPRWVIPLALAAGIAALFAIPLWRQDDGSGAAQAVAMLSDTDKPLPADVVLAPSTVRGPSDGEHVRLGAMLVVLEVAARSHDDVRARQAAAEIATLLKRMNALDVAAQYDSISMAAQYDSINMAALPLGGLDPELAERAETTARTASMTRLGEWLQAARIAAARQDQGFFKTSESQDRLDGKGFRADAKPGLRRARDGVAASRPDWGTIQKELGVLLEGLAR